MPLVLLLLNKVIIKQVASSSSLFIQILYHFWNTQFRFIYCTVFGIYRLLLYVVLYLEHTVWFYMLYCVWNIQFGVICYIVFGTYSLVLYVVLYLEHTVFLYIVLCLEHTVWFYILY